MKKLLAVLLALVAIGGFVFAEDAAPAPVVSGSVQTGLWVSGVEGSDVVSLSVKNYGNVIGLFVPNFVNLAVSYDGKQGGLYVSVCNNDFTDPAAQTVTLDYAYGYVNFGSIAKLTLGMMSDYTFATPVNYYGTYDLEQGGTGALLDITPVAGLDVGVFLPLFDSYHTALPALTADPSPLNELDFVAKYAMKDLGLTLFGGFCMASDFYNGGADAYAAADNQNDLYVAAKYTGVKNLSATFEFGWNNLGSTDVTNYKTAASPSYGAASMMTITEYAKYTMDALSFSLTAREFLYTVNSNFGFRVDPDVNYTLGDFKFGITGRYYSNPQAAAGADAINSFRVKPYVNVTVGDWTVKPFFFYSDGNTAVANNATWAIGCDVAWSF